MLGELLLFFLVGILVCMTAFLILPLWWIFEGAVFFIYHLFRDRR